MARPVSQLGFKFIERFTDAEFERSHFRLKFRRTILRAKFFERLRTRDEQNYLLLLAPGC